MTEIRKIDDKVSEVFIHAGDYSASVYTYGAILHTFCHCGHDILIGYDSYEAYIGNPGHIAEVVGPFANRIAAAAFTMDGRTFELEKNDGPNNLHSGSKNFGSKYWNQVHGFTPDDVLKDKEGLQTMRTLGENMAWLLKCIDAGKKPGVTFPEHEPRIEIL